MAFSKRSITHAILGLFQEAYKPAFHALALSWIVSWYFFSWETLYSAVLSLTNMLSLCQIMISRAPSAIPEHNIFCCSVVARILTPSLNVAFGLNRASKNKCRARAGFGLRPGSGFKMRPFYNSLWVCMQGPTRGEWKHTSSTQQQ